MINSSEAAATVDPRETEHFARLAADWWNPTGSSAMLHRLNPVRLSYIRDQIDHHWGGDECGPRALVPRRGQPSPYSIAPEPVKAGPEDCAGALLPA